MIECYDIVHLSANPRLLVQRNGFLSRGYILLRMGSSRQLKGGRDYWGLDGINLIQSRFN